MKLKPQSPANGISLTGDYKDAKSYKISCDCHSDDHSVDMWIEIDGDKETQDVQLGFYVTTWTADFWKNWPARLKAVYDILVKGVHRQEHHLILNKQAALNLAKVIEGTVNELDTR